MKRFFRAIRILPSTRSFVREARRTPGFGFLELIHAYIYARWPYLYIGIGTGEHRSIKFIRPVLNLALQLLTHRPADRPMVEKTGLKPTRFVDNSSRRTTFADTYHGKVVPLKAAQKIVSIKKEINLTDLEKVIPYAKAKDLILNHPDHILLLECPCRAVRPNPCLPLDVCLIVGEPFAGFAHEHYPQRSRWITSAEAIKVLQETDARGNVHHAFFKDAMFGRFFAICNCCSCCCGAMQAFYNGVPMLAASGYVNRVDTEKCVGCGTCVDSCGFGALSMENKAVEINDKHCMGCGICVSKCPQEALTLARDPSKGEPLELDALTTDNRSRLCSNQ